MSGGGGGGARGEGGSFQRSPSELSAKRADSGVKTQRLVFFLKGQNWRFCIRFGGQSRTESSPGALRSFCGPRGESPPPPAASSALHLHLRRLCRVPCLPPATSCGCSCSCAFIAGSMN
jgi:hypothetical protein